MVRRIVGIGVAAGRSVAVVAGRSLAAVAGLSVATLLVAACGGGDAGDPPPDEAPPIQAADEQEAATEPATVSIVAPEDGAVVEQGPLLVVMEVTGLSIVSAGVMDPGTGHHHLIVDADVDWTLPIPNDPGVHYHMGQAQTEFTLEDLAPGEHQIVAVVADGVHIPLDPPVADTITVVVR